MKERRERIRRALFGRGNERFINATRKAMPSGRLLDVGAGMGDLLDCARQYYECTALEPSPIAADALRQQGYQVIESTLEDCAIPEMGYDIIILDSVIEHVRSPKQALEKIHSMLNPGGVVAMKTPKFGGPASIIHGKGWNGFRHGHHTFLFSGATLSGFLRATGFEVLRSPRRNRLLDDVLILWGRKPDYPEVVTKLTNGKSSCGSPGVSRTRAVAIGG
ncbi:MAG: hypothetical protein CMJ46_03560 [Planctomyces sp.]|nr:hypothetical protein [Planctomyces sp.]